MDVIGNESGCEGVELSGSKVVRLEGFGIVPCSLSGLVVMDWTVDHGFVWFVVFPVHNELFEARFQSINQSIKYQVLVKDSLRRICPITSIWQLTNQLQKMTYPSPYKELAQFSADISKFTLYSNRQATETKRHH